MFSGLSVVLVIFVCESLQYEDDAYDYSEYEYNEYSQEADEYSETVAVHKPDRIPRSGYPAPGTPHTVRFEDIQDSLRRIMPANKAFLAPPTTVNGLENIAQSRNQSIAEYLDTLQKFTLDLSETQSFQTRRFKMEKISNAHKRTPKSEIYEDIDTFGVERERSRVIKELTASEARNLFYGYKKSPSEAIVPLTYDDEVTRASRSSRSTSQEPSKWRVSTNAHQILPNKIGPLQKSALKNLSRHNIPSFISHRPRASEKVKINNYYLIDTTIMNIPLKDFEYAGDLDIATTVTKPFVYPTRRSHKTGSNQRVYTTHRISSHHPKRLTINNASKALPRVKSIRDRVILQKPTQRKHNKIPPQKKGKRVPNKTYSKDKTHTPAKKYVTQILSSVNIKSSHNTQSLTLRKEAGKQANPNTKVNKSKSKTNHLEYSGVRKNAKPIHNLESKSLNRYSLQDNEVKRMMNTATLLDSEQDSDNQEPESNTQTIPWMEMESTKTIVHMMWNQKIDSDFTELPNTMQDEHMSNIARTFDTRTDIDNQSSKKIIDTRLIPLEHLNYETESTGWLSNRGVKNVTSNLAIIKNRLDSDLKFPKIDKKPQRTVFPQRNKVKPGVDIFINIKSSRSNTVGLRTSETDDLTTEDTDTDDTKDTDTEETDDTEATTEVTEATTEVTEATTEVTEATTEVAGATTGVTGITSEISNETSKDSNGTTGPKFDPDVFLEILANITYDYDTNLTLVMNMTLREKGVPTCGTPKGWYAWMGWPNFTYPSNTITTTTEPSYEEPAILNNTVIAKCFVCGLKTRGIPYHSDCADAFAGDFLPLVPMNPLAKAKAASYRRYCRYGEIYNYHENASRPKSVYGRWTGGCSVRWTDLTGLYTQRSCRNRRRAVTGLHYASKRMAKLEMSLSHTQDGCIITPAATLLPMSRGVSLYSRFHACVCTGNWCNMAAALLPAPARGTLAAAAAAAAARIWSTLIITG